MKTYKVRNQTQDTDYIEIESTSPELAAMIHAEDHKADDLDYIKVKDHGIFYVQIKVQIIPFD
jgi:hypothetical protein